ALTMAQPHKAYTLKRKDKKDLANDQLLFSKVFNYANQVLNVLQPEVYLRPDQATGLQLANCVDKGQLLPSFVAGQDLLSGRPEKELAYTISCRLSYLRPEHYLKLAVPTLSELKVIFLVALKMVNPQFPVKIDPQVINQWMEAIRRNIDPRSLEGLAVVV